MSRLVFAGGSELDAETPAGRVLDRCQKVAVVTLAAAFRRPAAIRADIRAWADALDIDYSVVAAVRRSDSLDSATSTPIMDADGVLVLDGSPAHLVGAIKQTPLLDAIVSAQARGATVVWSGAAATAACDPMVDDRGGALTVGLGLYTGIATATGWDRWPSARRRRLRRLIPESVLFVALESGAAVQSSTVKPNVWDTSPNGPQSAVSQSEQPGRVGDDGQPGEAWTVIGGIVEAQRAGRPVSLRTAV